MKKWHKNEKGQYICDVCGKSFHKNGIGTHIWKTHTEEGKKHDPGIGFKEGKREIWNKGLTKESSLEVLKNSLGVSKSMKKRVKDGKWNNPGLLEKTREINSIRQSLKNSGGKTKWYKVDNIYVQGTWERDFAIKLNEFDIKWIRCNKEHILKYNNKRYTPDFFIPNIDVFIEIKGYWWKNDRVKMRYVIKQNFKIRGKLKIIRKKKFDKLINCINKDCFLEMIKRGCSSNGRAPE